MDNRIKKLITHLVSDGSGQTVKHVAKTALSQFTAIEVKKYNWPMITNKELLSEVLSKIAKNHLNNHSVVIYTIARSEIRNALRKCCHDLQVPCISVVGQLVREIAMMLQVGTGNGFHAHHKFDIGYFDKLDAIDYTLKHDDGQMIHNLPAADIILIGPSRTSKTPTAVYLAYNGFKTANVPYIYGCPFPENCLAKSTNSLVIGLVISPARLVEIRETRMSLLRLLPNTNYTDPKIVEAECLQIKRICQAHNWPVIDVSTRSIEETAALVMKYYYDRIKRH